MEEVSTLDVNQEYVDVQDALKRIGGSMDLYKRLLTQFSGGDHIGPLEEALNAGAMDDASRAIHTLKGVASNLSLKKLSAESEKLEHNIKDGVDCSATFTDLKNAYDETALEIAKII